MIRGITVASCGMLAFFFFWMVSAPPWAASIASLVVMAWADLKMER